MPRSAALSDPASSLTGRLRKLKQQLAKLPVSPPEAGFQHKVMLLEDSVTRGRPDLVLLEMIENKVAGMEADLADTGFLSADPKVGLAHGDVLLGASERSPIRVSFLPGGSNQVIHGSVSGATGTGKSCLLGSIASQAARGCHTLVLDTTNSFSKLRAVHESHDIIRLRDLRLNPYDVSEGISSQLVDQVMTHELCRSYGLQFAELVIVEAIRELREKGKVDLATLTEFLRHKRYQGSFSRKSLYRDSAVLALTALLEATWDVFKCSRGMDLQRVLGGNRVIEMDGLLPQHQVFIVRYFIEFVHLLALGGRPFDKPLVVFVDEGQVLADEKGFAAKMLVLRHAGIHVMANYQNASAIPVEASGNSDLLVAFRSPDRRDKTAFAASAGLAPEQTDSLGRLENRECVVSLPRSGWKRPFLARLPEVEFIDVSREEVTEKSRRLTRSWSWEPLKDCSREGREAGSGMDPRDVFLRDCLNQTHEFSPLTKRFERAGIRSAAVQKKILRELITDGMIRIWKLAVTRGAPWSLVEPYQKALDQYNVMWKKTRGVLPTRAATHLLEQKISSLDGYQVVREGKVAGKQVDLVCRDDRGNLLSIEVAHSSGHELHNAVAVIEAVKGHFVVCTSTATKEEVQKKFADMSVEWKRQIEVVTLARALSREWKPRVLTG